MGTFSIWHWLIVLLVFGVPVVAVATERSGRAIPRGKYALWWVGLFAYGAIAKVVIDSGVLVDESAAVFVLVYFLGLALLLFLYNRAVVQRLRDAGHGKALAYVGVVPFVNLLLAIYLLFRPSAEMGQGAALTD